MGVAPLVGIYSTVSGIFKESSVDELSRKVAYRL